MKRPIIMATIADNRCTPEFVGALRQAGMQAVRINSAHITPERFAQMVEIIRRVDPEIQILMDTKGPEIRTGAPTRPISLELGATIALRLCDGPSTPQAICVNFPILKRYIHLGSQLIIDDGAVMLEITATDDDQFTAICRRAGTIDARKTINIPDADIRELPAVSERDAMFIQAAVDARIDIIAHSFVRSAADVRAVRELIQGSGIRLFPKIECRLALNNLSEIMAEADGVLIARGDLGSQVDIARIPAIQADIMSRCRHAGLPAILSTQILQSMIHSPVPTRAEVSDIYLATIQGADYLLLCGETAQGQYPRECVEVMNRTISASVNG